MTDHEYSQGICADGAAILKDGAPMTPEEIVRELQANQQGNLDGSDHIADANKMVPQGDVTLIGDFIDEEGNAFVRALVVEFKTVGEFLAAKRAGQCRFTVFGGEV